MTDDFRARLSEAETYANKGQSKAAAREIRRWIGAPIPREALARAARLARRSALPLVAIRWRHPIVQDATVSETLEYAAALLDAGITGEAGRWLATVDEQKMPVAFYTLKARCLLSNGDPHSAIPFYLKCLPMLESTEAASLAVELARAQLLAGEPAIALETLRKPAEDSTPGARALLTMAKAFLTYQSNPVAQERVLGQVRYYAERQRDFELVRECDRLKTQATDDKALWEKLYFGSSSKAFRERLLQGSRFSPPSEYPWTFGPRSENATGPALDLSTGQVTGETFRLKVGQIPHRLVASLCSDFYSDFSIGRLHELVYPNRDFHPDFSVPHIYEAVKRLRKLLVQHELPWTISEAEGKYRLTARSTSAIVVSLKVPQAPRVSQLMACLKEQWRSRPFSMREASSTLGISPRGTVRLLAQAREAGQLKSVGKSRAILYQFKN